MDAVVKELQAAGATIVDVAIADYDAKYAAVRGARRGRCRRDGPRICRAVRGRGTRC